MARVSNGRAKASPYRQTASIMPIPAPIGGLNARDPLASMKPTDAVILTNAIPGTGGVSVRGGSITYAMGLGAPVATLMRHNPPGSLSKLFAAAGGKLFNVTSGGVAGAASLSGMTSDTWLSVNFGTPGGNYLIAANGSDNPQKFDGTTWTAVSLVAPQPATYSGTAYSYPYTLTPSKMTAPCVFGSRLWFAEEGSLRAWFMPLNAIGSSVQNAPASGGVVPDISPCCQALDFSSQCTQGGSLVAVADWTRDGGTGSDDYAIFITSAGEVLVYQGTDPTSAATWSKVGLFRIPPPVGKRFLIKAGADLAIVTQQGILPLSSILPLALSQSSQIAYTDKIKGLFATAYGSAGQMAGWQLLEYAKGALIILNVPQPNGTFQQFVQNVLTGAWCVFTGLAALCWGDNGDTIFFGTQAGTVVRYDVGNQDNGQPISAVIMPAFSNFRTPSQKRFLLARPLYNGAPGYKPPLILKTDYDTSQDVLAQPAIPATGTPWGSRWYSPWGATVGPQSSWQGIRGEGQVATVLMSIATRTPMRFDHVDVTYATGSFF